jgi:hypothetical protein
MSELFLSLEEIRKLINDKKEDEQRKANQSIHKEDLKAGICALYAKETLEQFFYTCQLRAGAFAPVTADARSKKQIAIDRAKERASNLREMKKAQGGD